MCINSRKFTAMGPSHSFQDPFSCVFSPYKHPHTPSPPHTHTHARTHTHTHLLRNAPSTLLCVVSLITHTRTHAHKNENKYPSGLQTHTKACICTSPARHAATLPCTLPCTHKRTQTRTHTKRHTSAQRLRVLSQKNYGGNTPTSRRARTRSHSSAPTVSLPQMRPPLETSPRNALRGGSTAPRQHCAMLDENSTGSTPPTAWLPRHAQNRAAAALRGACRNLNGVASPRRYRPRKGQGTKQSGRRQLPLSAL